MIPLPISKIDFVNALLFDPEGSGYDYRTALSAGMDRDATGHMGSRDPTTGQILKGRQHPTYHLAVKGEKEAGHEIYKGEDGRYYSRPKENNMANDAASQAQAVIDLMNQMDAGSGEAQPAQPTAQPVQPQMGGLFNFLSSLPVLGGFLKPDAAVASDTVPAQVPKAKAKAKAPAKGATGALMQRKMLNEALRGDDTLTNDQLIELMSGNRR